MPTLYWIVSGAVFLVALGFTLQQGRRYEGNPLTSSYRANLWTLVIFLALVLFFAVPLFFRARDRAAEEAEERRQSLSSIPASARITATAPVPSRSGT